ncbi:MAG: hypothetical protein HC837_02240 [Chloroflexaceae bacterium]|nr:hypothetical protein [Chloroflexaceae bacterium]
MSNRLATAHALKHLWPLLEGMLSRMSDADYAQLLQGQGQIAFVAPGAAVPAPGSLGANPDLELQTLAEQLKQHAELKEIQTVFKRLRTRDRLRELATLLEIPLARNATKAVIEQAIVEALLGPQTDPNADLDDLITQIHACETREAAYKLLQPITPKARLLELARRLKVNAGSKDNIASLKEKIVEFVVGSRLRSQAILNLNLDEDPLLSL